MSASLSARAPLYVLVLVVVGALAPTARAAPPVSASAPTDGARARSPAAQLDEAWAALDALELERASAILEPLVTSSAPDPQTRARAWLALGLTRASLLDDKGARAAFAAALAIDGTLTLPASASPKVRALLEETRASLLPEGVPPPTPAPVAEAPPPAAEAPPTNDDSAAPLPEAEDEGAPADSGAPWPFVVTSGALALGSVVAGAGAVAADLDLARAPAGRTRAEYDATRALGVVALAASITLGAGALTVLGAALLQEPVAEGGG